MVSAIGGNPAGRDVKQLVILLGHCWDFMSGGIRSARKPIRYSAPESQPNWATPHISPAKAVTFFTLKKLTPTKCQLLVLEGKGESKRDDSEGASLGWEAERGVSHRAGWEVGQGRCWPGARRGAKHMRPARQGREGDPGRQRRAGCPAV